MSSTAQADAVRFLRDQHDTIRELFSSVADAKGDERREVFEPLVRLLAVHETAEEMVIYPALRSAGDEGTAIVDARTAEEDQAKKMLADLEKLDPASDEFNGLFIQVRAAVEQHAEKEEQEAFPLLERVTDDEQLKRMTSALKVAEGIAPTHPHKSAPESATGNAIVGPFVAVADRVRDAITDAIK
jgi:hemerythrin superfamily protein